MLPTLKGRSTSTDEYTFLSPTSPTRESSTLYESLEHHINDLESQSRTLLNATDDRPNSVVTEATAIGDRDMDSIEDTKLGIYSIIVVCASAVGGILFGFDTAIISSCLLFINQDLGHVLSSFEKELITAVTSITALIGAVSAGYLSDKFGRRNTLALCCLVFIISAIQMGVAHSVFQLVAGRAVVGVAVGGASMVVPVFISEVAPSNIRGMLLAVNSISTTGGQLIAYLVANGLKNVENNWRYSFLVSGIPPFLFLLAVKFIPESPRYSIIKGQTQQAEDALSRIYPYAEPDQVQDRIFSIQVDVNNAKQLYNVPFWEVIKSKKSTQNALLTGSILMAIQQCVGFNAFMYYSATIFKNLGFEDPIFASISIALTNFLFSFFPLFLVDKVGRRKMLLRTVWILAVALAIASAVYSVAPENHPEAEAGVSTSNVIASIAIILYVAGYASGLGTVPWSSVEFLPLEARAIGGTIITCCNWSTNSIISFTYLTLMDKLSPGFTFGFFGIICLLSWLWIYMSYPDVSGIPLEEISKIFDNGVDIKLADELRNKHEAHKRISFSQI